VNVEDVTNKRIVYTIIPDDFALGAGQPLQHAALLPAPGAAFAELSPAVAVAQINHTDFDHVVGQR